MPSKRVQKRPGKFRLAVDKHGNLIIPLDQEGKPDYGKVMRHCRKYVKEWTAERLAILYSEALRGDGDEEPITARWIQLMEQKNEVPRDPKRRHILAALLGIPLASFGLESLEPQKIANIPVASILPEKTSLDIGEYRTTLHSYWEQHYLGTAQHSVSDMLRRVNSLQYHFIYAGIGQKAQTTRLLCGYQMLLGEIARDYGEYNTAIDYLNMAIMLAKENAYHDLHAAALHFRGNSLFNIWEVCHRQEYLTKAVEHYDEVQTLDRATSFQLKGTKSIFGGMTYANNTHNDQTKVQAAMKLLDQGGNMMRQGIVVDNELFLVKLNEDLYHNMRGSTLLALGRPDAALDELLLMKRDVKQDLQRRYANNDILQARAYADQGLYPIATTLATDALAQVKTLKSGINIARIANLYDKLKKSPYGNNSDVTMLGIELMKVQHPQIFR